jgi:transcriptional regulator GlxA family with amidase domain
MSHVPHSRFDPETQTIGFLLLPGFALMSFAAATEPLRAANLLAGKPLYRVELFGEARTVPASSGLAVATLPLRSAGASLSLLFTCAGGEPGGWHRPAVHRTLRRIAASGVRLGGISGGPYVMAAAGLLEARRFTIHWEHAPALAEAFPGLRPEQARFVIDRDRLTCGGGIAPLDMMHALIAERMGADFARRVSDWFLHTQIEPGAGPQRASLAERFGVHHPLLLAVLDKMASTIDAPLSRDAMARFAGISPRHLDRLFAVHRRSTFLADYHRLRLDHADKLLRQSALSVSEIAFATGFSSSGHFGRAYRRIYGLAPNQTRPRPVISGGAQHRG